MWLGKKTTCHLLPSFIFAILLNFCISLTPPLERKYTSSRSKGAFWEIFEKLLRNQIFSATVGENSMALKRFHCVIRPKLLITARALSYCTYNQQWWSILLSGGGREGGGGGPPPAPPPPLASTPTIIKNYENFVTLFFSHLLFIEFLWATLSSKQSIQRNRVRCIDNWHRQKLNNSIQNQRKNSRQ